MSLSLLLIIFSFTFLIGGGTSLLGIYFHKKFDSFKKLTSENAIILMFLVLILFRISISGYIGLYEQLGYIIVMVIMPIIFSCFGILLYKLITRLRGNNSDTSFSYNFKAGLVFPIILMFIVVIRAVL